MIKITGSMCEYFVGHNKYFIPSHMIEGLESYINYRVPQGSFLHAILCNDFIDACRRADQWNLASLPAFAFFLDNYAPSECYGSKEKVEAWINKGKTNG